MTDLPDLFDGSVDAVIFDLDGVITDTASVHTSAWKNLFDSYLHARAAAADADWAEFTIDDYHQYVDGKPRYDGVRSFLGSRGIELPEGTIDDGPDDETVCGLGNRKNALFLDVLERDGAVVFEGSRLLIQALRLAGIATGLVTSSRNGRLVLDTVGMTGDFAEILDGLDAAERGLPGKPAPDTYLDCARRLGVTVERAAMVEDAVSGVASGSAGGFVHVIGVDRGAGVDVLVANGATVVVDDLVRFVPSA